MFKFKLFKSTHHFKSNKLNKALFTNISSKKNLLPSSFTSIQKIKYEKEYYHTSIKSYERRRSGASKLKNWDKLQTEEMMKKKKGENIFGTSNTKKSSAIDNDVDEDGDIPLNEDDVIEIEESVKRSFNENVPIKDKDKEAYKFDARLTNKLGHDSKKLSKEFDNLKKHVLRAEAMIEKGHFEEALSSYESAMNVPIDYHTGPILIGMGICYIQLNEYERAIDLFKEVINIDPNNLSCYNNLAHAYFQIDKYEESLETYKKAIDIVKDDIEYYSADFVELNFHVGQIYLNIKEDNALAIQWFDRALLVDPDHGQILHFKAVALKNMGEQKSAKKVLLRAVENCEFPFPDTFYLLHKIFEGEGDEDTSAKYLQEYLDYQERLKKQGIEYNVY